MTIPTQSWWLMMNLPHGVGTTTSLRRSQRKIIHEKIGEDLDAVGKIEVKKKDIIAIRAKINLHLEKKSDIFRYTIRVLTPQQRVGVYPSHWTLHMFLAGGRK